MIAYSNLPRIKEIADSSSRVVDVGGGRHVLPYATHVIDLNEMSSQSILDPIDDSPLRFSEETWTKHDVCEGNLPFEDKYFDFSFCSHLLEDLRDPIVVCKELIRISKSGYIEVPSREREIFIKTRFSAIRSFMGEIQEIGYPHHRWFVEVKGTQLNFIAKDGFFFKNRKNFITRSQLGRKLTAAESASFLFWDSSFDFQEVIFDDISDRENEMLMFRKSAFRRLKNGTQTD